MYEGMGTFGDEEQDEMNGIPVTKIHGELLGDGSAAKADIDLLFFKPEGEEHVLLARYTSVSINGDDHEKCTSDLQGVLDSIKWNKAE